MSKFLPTQSHPTLTRQNTNVYGTLGFFSDMAEEDVESDGEDAGDMEGMGYVSDDDGDDALTVEGDGKSGGIAEKYEPLNHLGTHMYTYISP
jgi:hypothetical protein